MLYQHKNRKGTEYGGHNHTGVGIRQPHPVHNHKQWDHGNLGRNHHRSQVSTQNELISGKTQLCEGKRRHGGRQQGNDGIADGNEKRISNGFREWELGKHFYVGVPGRLLGNPLNRYRHQCPAAFEGGGNHPKKRYQCRYRQRNGDYIIEQGAGSFLSRHNAPTFPAPSSESQ